MHYVDQQGCYMKPASPEQMQEFLTFADRLNAPLLKARPGEEEEDAPEVEKISAMQGVENRVLVEAAKATEPISDEALAQMTSMAVEGVRSGFQRLREYLWESHGEW